MSNISLNSSVTYCPECRVAAIVDHDDGERFCPDCHPKVRMEVALLESFKVVKAGVSEEVKKVLEKDSEEQARRPSEAEVKQRLQSEAWEVDPSHSGSQVEKQRGEGASPWVLAIMSVIFILLAGLAMMYFIDNAHKAPKEIILVSDAKVENLKEFNRRFIIENSNEKEILEELNFDHDAAKQLIAKYYESHSVEELVPLVRWGDQLRVKMSQYYHDREINPHQFVSVRGPLAKHNELKMHLYEVNFEEVPAIKVLVKQEGDAYLLDWASVVVYQAGDWSKVLQQGEFETMEFRVNIQPATYYNGFFEDEAKWRPYRIMLPGNDELIYGYVSQERDLDRQIIKELGMEEGRTRQAIIKISRSKEISTKNQVLIDDVVSWSWVKHTNK